MFRRALLPARTQVLLLRPERLEIGCDAAEAVFGCRIRAPRGELVVNVDFVELRPNVNGQESGRLCPPMGIISTTRSVVISQRQVDMKRFARPGQGDVEDAPLFFKTL